MPDYQVRAEVVDISGTIPMTGDRYLVDTNPWLWLGYTRASQSSQLRGQPYIKFASAAVSTGARLIRLALSLTELAHVIERRECDIMARKLGADLDLKDFRHSDTQTRQAVVDEIDTAWTVVKQMSSSTRLVLEGGSERACLDTLRQHPVDGYDALFVQAAHALKVTGVLTDDSDYATVPGLRVYTANSTVIERAKSLGLLIE